MDDEGYTMMYGLGLWTDLEFFIAMQNAVIIRERFTPTHDLYAHIHVIESGKRWHLHGN